MHRPDALSGVARPDEAAEDPTGDAKLARKFSGANWFGGQVEETAEAKEARLKHKARRTSVAITSRCCTTTGDICAGMYPVTVAVPHMQEQESQRCNQRCKSSQAERVEGSTNRSQGRHWIRGCEYTLDLARRTSQALCSAQSGSQSTPRSSAGGARGAVGSTKRCRRS